ncbi:uncharacterized protein LOC127807836 isoform X2 [Diospyros lotus]|nr:uncharacterized protein LOC127807836 isoform X2 [Diospyros lotus]
MFKRQKTESSQRIEDINFKTSQAKHETLSTPPRESKPENRLVNWMSIDDNIELLHSENLKDSESVIEWDDDTDDSEGEANEYFDENDNDINHKNEGKGENAKVASELYQHLPGQEDLEGNSEPIYQCGIQDLIQDHGKDTFPSDLDPITYKRKLKETRSIESKMIGNYQVSLHTSIRQEELRASTSISLQKKHPKVAFCPKEVKRILESEVLQQKNAQSHTIRKIIVFASLGIRHGCEDMYELDFNHFSILHKGEPYVSPENPGEHVLYENPGVQRKIFYPNRQSLTLCPVQILEEEKAMRPSDASCPSCLFLCIKYGGRTRNLPQNEYVRQRMGRNKLKSFGLVMCQMARLVHIRSGSFFFKALGVTLLFMAGFPDDLVQKETKYRNLELLQKYYRTDEDAEGEELFLPHHVACNAQPCSNFQQPTGKAIPAKPKGKKHTNPATKPQSIQKASTPESTAPSSWAPPNQFGLIGYKSIETHAEAAFQSIPSQAPATSPTFSNPPVIGPGRHISYRNLTPYPPMFRPHAANAFVPVVYWPLPNAFPHCPYPPSYDYRSFPTTGNYVSVNPRPCYSNLSCNPLVSKMAEGKEKNDAALGEADSDSESSSSSRVPKEERIIS